jgi:hypothetical protein
MYLRTLRLAFLLTIKLQSHRKAPDLHPNGSVTSEMHSQHRRSACGVTYYDYTVTAMAKDEYNPLLEAQPVQIVTRRLFWRLEHLESPVRLTFCSMWRINGSPITGT